MGKLKTLRFVCITFDDGCESVYRNARPVLERQGMSAAVIVTTDADAWIFHEGEYTERRMTLEDLDETALKRILTEPKNALVKQYQRLFEMESVDLTLAEEALGAISRKAIERKTGARGLRSIMEGILLDTMFDLPSLEGVEEVVIGLTYSISEVHTHAYYAERAAALADCAEMDRLYLKDPGGLLTPAAVAELAPHFLRAAGERPVELHSHCTIGLAPFV